MLYLRILLVIQALCIVTQLGATNYIFTGAIDSAYNNPGNWSNGFPGFTLNQGDTISIYSGKCTIPENFSVSIFGLIQKTGIPTDPYLEVNGTLNVFNNGVLKSPVKINQVKVNGNLNNYGLIDARLTSDGHLLNNGICSKTVISAGTISGNGQFNSIDCNACSIEPGGSNIIGEMKVQSISFNQYSKYKIEIASAQSYDKIIYNNYFDSFKAPDSYKITKSFAPAEDTLIVSFLNGYLPTTNNLNNFQIIDYFFSFNYFLSFDHIVVPNTNPIFLEQESTSDGLILRERARFRFNGAGAGNAYTNPQNWQDDAMYAGYPGTDLNINMELSSVAECRVPLGTTVNIDCDSELEGQLINEGIINFKSFEYPTVAGISNSSSGEINLGGNLNVEGEFSNQGTLILGANLGTDGQFISDDIGYLNVDLITNVGNILMIDGRIGGAAYGDGLIEGSGGIIDTINCQGCTIRPGGQNGIGIISTKQLKLDEQSTLEIEIDGLPDSYNFDRITIFDGSSNKPQYIDGTLAVSKKSNFTFSTCADYNIISYPWDTLHGDFNSIVVNGFGGDDWQIEDDNPDFEFEVFPGESGDNALDLDGQDDFIHIGHDLGSIKTIEFEFLPEEINPAVTGDNIISLDDSEFSYIWTMQAYSAVPDERLTVFHEGNRLYTQYPFEKKWYHVAIVSEGTSGTYDKIYVNGIEVASFAIPSAPNIYNLSDFRIGSRKPYPQGYTQGFFNGRMDEFRFWSDTRTPAEIVANWNKELAPTDTQGLEAYYKMNQGRSYQNNSCVSYLKDYTENEKNGIIYQFGLNGNTGNWIRAEGCPSYVAKVNNTFNGDGDGVSWFDADNWSLDEVPTACHRAIIPSGFDVELDGIGAICYTLDVQGTIDVESVSSLESYAPRQ